MLFCTVNVQPFRGICTRLYLPKENKIFGLTNFSPNTPGNSPTVITIISISRKKEEIDRKPYRVLIE